MGCIELVENLTEDDRIGIVTYAGGAGIELDSVHGDQKEEIIKVINGKFVHLFFSHYDNIIQENNIHWWFLLQYLNRFG